MKTILRDTIEKLRNHLELLWEDIKLEQEKYTPAFYFDTAHLQRAALGYKDYYRDDDSFKKDKFKSDITLVCSLVSGGFVGPFRLLPPHQNEFLDKIKTRFGGVTYERWRDEVRTFVAHTGLKLNPDEFLSRLHTSSDEELIERFTEHTDMTKIGLNVSQCLLPWDRRVTAWQRKELLVTDAGKTDYDVIFSSPTFETLKSALDSKRTFKISNFIDATALTILMNETRAFREEGSKRVPRFFMPESKYDYLREALKETGLLSELTYTSVLGRPSTVLRNEEYFFYRAFFRRRPHNGGGASTEWGDRIKELYDKASEILETSTSVAHVDFEDKPLQEVLDEMENYSFLKNVWIEFINSGDLREILGDLEDIRREFDEARQSYDNMSFASRVQAALLKKRQDIFDNLDEVKQVSVIWDKIDSKVTALRKKLNGSNWDEDALFRNRKLFRYGFPDKYHAEIKKYLSDLLSLESEAEPSQRAISRVVSHYLKVSAPGAADNQRSLTLVTAVFCALEMRDRLRTLLSDLRKKKVALHYSLLIALAGALLDLNDSERGERLIDELVKLYYAEDTPPADRCNLAIGLTYLHYYAWLARKRAVERRGARQAENQKEGDDIRRFINNAIVFAERATSLVGGKELAQRVYVYNQHLFCLVESENPENNKKMREAAAKLREYMNQPDVWSYMYYDTLAHYFRWRALEQSDKARREAFMEKALALSDDAKTAAPHDEEIKNFHTKLIDESDSH